MADIAAEAGVSRNAVSLALRNDPSISQGTKNRIAAIAKRRGYTRNPVISEVMSRMGGRGRQGRLGGMAIFNANVDPQAFRRHPTIPNYLEGCRRRAELWGFALHTFWLHERGTSGSRWCDILTARGIRGLLIVGLMKNNRLPPAFAPVWQRFPCVVTGVRTREPALNFACVDHHILAKRAVEKAVVLGYQRPGLVLDQEIDDLVEGRFSSGYRLGQESLPAPQRLPPFFHNALAEDTFHDFAKWMRHHQPDLLLILYNRVRDWLERLGMDVPGHVGIIQLEWRSNRPHIAGMNQHNELAGEAAAEMLAGMIFRGQCGPPAYPVGTLIGPTWEDGPSACRPPQNPKS